MKLLLVIILIFFSNIFVFLFFARIHLNFNSFHFHAFFIHFISRHCLAEATIAAITSNGGASTILEMWLINSTHLLD